MTGHSASIPSCVTGGAAHLAAQEARLCAHAATAWASLGHGARRLGVVGAGTMGRTIAFAALEAGMAVTVLDSHDAPLQAAAQDLERWSAKAGIDSAARLLRDFDGLAEVDIVIESVFEDEMVKRKVLRRIEAAAPAHALLTTNSSTLDIDRLAAALQDPGRFVGTHFFLPAHRTPVLEVVAGRATSEEARRQALALAHQLGKVPIEAGNCDGYVGNRLFDRFWQEAVHLVEQGTAPGAVDAALTEWGMALGPLATLDRIGNDLLAGVVARRAAQRPGAPRSHLLQALVEAGRKGLSCGAGWYDYAEGSRTGTASGAVADLAQHVAEREAIAVRSCSPEEIVAACVSAVIDEGHRLLAEGHAQSPGDIDVMFTRAYGFPASSGGPMHLSACLAHGERACA